MNDLLQNKWVVSALGAAAVLIVAIQFWPASRPQGRVKSASSAPAAEPAAGSSTEKQTSGSGAAAAKQGVESAADVANAAVEGLPSEPADRVYLAEHFREWRESPLRDPFDNGIRRKQPAVRIPPAKEMLNLTAIWRQTGDSLAVVNSQIVGVADRVDGYEVLGIAGDYILVDGHKGLGREQVPFGVRRAPVTSKKATSKSRSRSGRATSRS